MVVAAYPASMKVEKAASRMRCRTGVSSVNRSPLTWYPTVPYRRRGTDRYHERWERAMTVLVTGAAGGQQGKTGRRVTELLRARDIPVRAMVRTDDDRADH